MAKKPGSASDQGIRDNKGRFRKGCSGNPAGKPKNTLYQAMAKMTVDNSDLIAEKITEMIQAGDAQIMAQLLKHSLPKGRLIQVELSDKDPAGSVLTAVSEGKLSADEGQAMARIIELVDHEKRLRDIEARLEKEGK